MLNVQCNTIHAVLLYYPYPLTPLLFSTPLARNCQFMLICFQYSTNFIFTTASLNEDFEIKNELKKLHTEPFSSMPRHYKNAKKQIFSWEKLAGNSKCLML